MKFLQKNALPTNHVLLRDQGSYLRHNHLKKYLNLLELELGFALLYEDNLFVMQFRRNEFDLKCQH